MLHIQLTKAEAGQLKFLLDRSLNTLSPSLWPEWAQELLGRLEKYPQE